MGDQGLHLQRRAPGLARGGGEAELAPAQAEQTVTTADQVTEGKQLFTVNCSSCHGLNGEGIRTEGNGQLEEDPALVNSDPEGEGWFFRMTLSDKSQKKYNDLMEKTGKDFEDAYTDCMVKDHKDAVDKFKKQADKGEDADLKSWAAGKVAALEHHLEMAKATEKTVDEIK